MQSSRPLTEIKTRLFTGVLSDILDSMGKPGQVADLDLIQVVPGTRVVGRAQTARATAVNALPPEPYKHLLSAIDATGPGRVLVISGSSSSTSALFGGLLATAVNASGGAGVVVEGYARDADEIKEIGLPTLVRGFRPLDSYGRDEVVEISECVSIGGVLVNQGDLVFGDDDGLVFVPHDIEDAVVERAFEKVQGERSMREALSAGMSVAQAFAKFGIL